MTARLFSMGLFGLETYTVEVEADISRGLPAFDIVGLPDTAVRESRERVRAAMKNCGFDFPVSRITMNLAPADKKKEGPMYDLPLLAALLAATGQLNRSSGRLRFCGRAVPFRGNPAGSGRAAHGHRCREAGFRRLFVPAENAREGAVAEGLEVYPVKNVRELTDHLEGISLLSPAVPAEAPQETAASALLDFFRRAGTTGSQAGFGNCRQRRTQCADGRAARLRQKYAGQADSHHPAGHDL